MKKILLSASICMLALFAGCTRDIADNGNTEQDKDAIQFFGSTDTDATKVTFGDVNSSTEKVPILWSNADAIGLFSGEYKLYPDKPDNPAAHSITNKDMIASTPTPSTSTGFKPSFGKIDTKGQAVSFWAYYPFTNNNNMRNVDALTSPLKIVQTFDATANNYPDRMYMVSNEAIPDAHKIVKLKFTNAFALINVGVKGNAKIDSIQVSGFTMNAVCNGGLVNLKKAPAAGSNAAAFNASGFLTRAKDDVSDNRTVTMKLGSSLRLIETVHYIPLMILPTEYDSNTGLTVTIYGTDKEGAKSSITRTGLGKIAAGTKEIKTNEIIYINLKDIKAEELNQNPPKTTLPAGEELFADDFSWVVSYIDSENAKTDSEDGTPSEPGGFPQPGGGAQQKYLKSGLFDYLYTDSNSKMYRTDLRVEEAEVRAIMDKKYMLNEDYISSMYGLYRRGEGGMKLGGFYGNSNLVIPMDLEMAKESLKFTFKATATNTDVYGETMGDYLSLNIPVIVIGDGNIKGGTSKQTEISVAKAPAWGEYTVIIEGATSNTQIQIGGNVNTAPAAFIVDDLKITVAEASDVSGSVELGEPDPAFTDVMPEDGNVAIGWSAGSKSVFAFTLTGTWDITGCPEWLAMKPGWATDIWDEKAVMLKSDFGNELPSYMKIYALETNPTDAPRSATVTVTSRENPSVNQSFTITQGATPAKVTVLTANFGTVTGEAIPIIKGSVNWGATLEAGVSIIDNFDKDGNNTKIELTNETLVGILTETTIPAATYPGATPGGCYNFKAITEYDASIEPNIGFGFTVPTEGKSVVTVSFGMYLGHGKEYNSRNFINVYDDQGYNEIKNATLVAGWNYYTISLPVVNNSKTKTIKIFPPTDGRISRKNSVLLDDVKVEVQ